MDNKEEMYYKNLEKMIRVMNNSLDDPDFGVRKMKDIIASFAESLRVSKIIVTVYENPKQEAMGRGTVIRVYDSGTNSILANTEKVNWGTTNIYVCKMYQPEYAEPWSEEEKERVDLIRTTLLVYAGRNKLKNVIEKLTFFDSDDYKNLNYYFKRMQQLYDSKMLGQYSAAHFNLKHFSLINQQIGRNAGTFVMRSFYDKLQSMMAEDGIVCRLGGDNFIALFKKQFTDKFSDFLSGTQIVYNVNADERILVSATGGVFEIPEDFIMHDTGNIMDKIITASNIARNSGSEGVVYWNTSMEASKERVAQIQQLFSIALEEEEFHVFYQPKVDVNGNRLAGAEALCRWFHDGGIIPPMEFIPVLEQGTDICRLDFYMLEHVCRDIRRWLASGMDVVRVSVNLSRKHMMDLDLLERIIDIVDKYNVPHEYIEIELTETTTDVEFRDLKRVVRGLQQVGICASVDDFGMGYSSLNLIKEIPWNVLKVDKSFLPLESENDDSIRAIMFKYVVAMAKAMGLECVAEGVETENQVEILRNNNCDLAQGFYYDRPMPVEDFETRLKDNTYGRYNK